MSTRQYCSFSLDGQLFGLEIEHVQEVLREQAMTAIPLAPRLVRGLINLRGDIVPALDLRVRLALPPREQAANNVVLRTGAGPVSLLVDEIGDVLALAEAELEAPPDNLDGPAARLVRGVYELDERLLLILDAGALGKLDELGEAPAHG